MHYTGRPIAIDWSKPPGTCPAWLCLPLVEVTRHSQPARYKSTAMETIYKKVKIINLGHNGESYRKAFSFNLHFSPLSSEGDFSSSAVCHRQKTTATNHEIHEMCQYIVQCINTSWAEWRVGFLQIQFCRIRLLQVSVCMTHIVRI